MTGPADGATIRTCRVCGCTDEDCRQCIAKTGEPCHWVEADLCSACQPSHPEFSVCQFFKGGAYEYVRRAVGPEEAVKAAHHYTHSVAAKFGIVERVIITDGDDFTCFEWKLGEGVTFPPEARGRQ
jgi:hypothetical protein